MSDVDRVSCGLCHYKFERGAHVCQGCGGDIVYGPTKAEEDSTGKLWAVLWGGGAILLLGVLPALLKEKFGLPVAPGWGLGWWTLLAIAAAGFWGYAQGVGKAHGARYNWVRTFRRTHV